MGEEKQTWAPPTSIPGQQAPKRGARILLTPRISRRHRLVPRLRCSVHAVKPRALPVSRFALKTSRSAVKQ